MQATILALLTSVASNPQVQEAVMKGVGNLFGSSSLPSIVTNLLGTLKTTTHPTASSTPAHATSSKAVKSIQTLINQYAPPTPLLTVDGYLGPKTENAVLAALAKFGISV